MFGCATRLIRPISFLKLSRSCKVYFQAFISAALLQIRYCTDNSAAGAAKDSRWLWGAMQPCMYAPLVHSSMPGRC